MSKMKEQERLIKNTYFLFLDFIAVTILSLAFWVVVWKKLPPSDAGIIATSMNTMVILSTVAIFGLQTSLPKLIAEYKEESQWKKIKSLIAFSIKSILITSFVIFLAFLIFSQSLSEFMKLPIQAIYVVGSSVFIWSFWNLSGSILFGLQNMKRIFLTNLAGNSVKIVFTFLLTYIGFMYLGPLLGLLIGLFVVVLLRISSFSFRSKNSVGKREFVYKYTLPAFIGSIALMVFSNTPYIILTVIKNTEATGIFVTAMTMVLPISVIPGTIGSALFPITSQLAVTRNAYMRQRYLIYNVLRHIFFIMFPILIFMLFFITPIILLFSRIQYIQATKPFPILAVAALILGTGYILHSSLFAIRKPKASRNISVLTALMFLLLSIPLTYYYSTIGLSVAYLISVFTLAFTSFIYLKKTIGLKVPWSSIFKTMISAAIFSAILYFVDIIQTITLIKAAISLFAFLIYALLLIPLKYYTREDVKILKYLVQRIPKAAFIVNPIIKLISKSI